MIIKANIYWSLTTCHALCCFPCILSFNLHLPHPPSYWYYHRDFVGEETELCDMAKITQWEVLGTFLFARLIIQFNISNIICRPQVLSFPTFKFLWRTEIHSSLQWEKDIYSIFHLVGYKPSFLQSSQRRNIPSWLSAWDNHIQRLTALVLWLILGYKPPLISG